MLAIFQIVCLFMQLASLK